jgi:hypothetical protein
VIRPRFPPTPVGPRYGRLALSLVAAATVAACITLMFWAMRAVMDVGGACASGNSGFEIAQPCPDGTWVMPVAIILGLIAAFAFALLAPPGLGALAGLAWCGLFLSLGWNFLEYGVDPPGPQDGLVWGWLICGIVFVLMGGGPLLAAVPLVRGAGAAARMRRAAAERAATPTAPPPPSVRRVAGRRTADGDGATAGARSRARTPADDDGDVVDRLERLAAMRRRGELSDAEYEDAKRHVLGEDAP